MTLKMDCKHNLFNSYRGPGICITCTETCRHECADMHASTCLTCRFRSRLCSSCKQRKPDKQIMETVCCDSTPPPSCPFDSEVTLLGTHGEDMILFFGPQSPETTQQQRARVKTGEQQFAATLTSQTSPQCRPVECNTHRGR